MNEISCSEWSDSVSLEVELAVELAVALAAALAVAIAVGREKLYKGIRLDPSVIRAFPLALDHTRRVASTL